MKRIKYEISLIINIILLIICVTLGVLLYNEYNKEDIVKIPKETIELVIGSETITRVGILSSNGKHYEITNNEDISKLRNTLNHLKCQIVEDTNTNTNNIPGVKFYITFYSLWDRIMFECAIIDEETVRYNGYNYAIVDNKIDINAIVSILDKFKK